MKKRLFGTDGVRGVANIEPMTAEMALQLGRAIAHVFKKEQQEYVPTMIADRLRIETIIYVELSIVNIMDGDVVRNFDYIRLPKDLFFSQPDKVMSADDLASKRILDVTASLQCPSSNWQEEREACVRCARRMSSKLDQAESRVSIMD